MSTDSSSPAATGSTGTTTDRKIGLGAVFLTLFLDLAGFSIIFPLFPGMLAYYLQHDTTGLLAGVHHWLQQLSGGTGGDPYTDSALFGGLLGSVYAVLQFIFAPLWGSLSDKIGRRRLLLLTCTGAFLSYVAWVFAGSFELLVLARLIGGAMAGNLAVATAVVADVTSRENRAKGMGLVGVAIGLGFVCGPAIGGISAHWNLLDYFPGGADYGLNPFSLPALIAAVLALINLAFVATRLPETLPPERRNPVVRWRDRVAVLGVLSLEGAALRRVNLVSWLYLIAFAAMEFTLGFLLAAPPFSLGHGGIAAVLVYVGFILILTQGLIVRRFVPKWGEVKSSRLGLGLVALGLSVLAFAPSLVWVYVAQTFTAMGAGLSNATLATLASLYASPEQQGRVAGLFRSLGSLSRALGPILGGILLWKFGGTVNYGLGAVLVAVALGLAWTLPKAR